MEVVSLSSPSPFDRVHLCQKEPRFLAGSSSSSSSYTNLLCSHRGTTNKLLVLRPACNSAQSSLLGILGIPRKPKNVAHACLSFCPKEEFHRPRYSYDLHGQKYARDMVVRCELAATGSAGDSYSLSELKMEAKVRGAGFYIVTAFAAIFLFVVMLVGHPFVLMFDRHQRKFHHFVAKHWAALSVAPFFKIKFEGLENLPPPDTHAVYVSNHQSFLDIYTLLTLGRSFKFISKTQIFLFPIIGWAMFLLGTIPLKRMDSRSQLDCFKRCIDLIKKGASVFFFPEGTRSKDGKICAFKIHVTEQIVTLMLLFLGDLQKGAFSVAAKTNAPVVPITLIGTGQIMPAGREGILNFGFVEVVIHKPIHGNDPETLCKEARKTIASVLTQT